MTDPMVSFALAGAAAALMVGYWIFCRRVSLRHRQKAAVLLDSYFQDDNVSETDKSSVYFTYRWASHWHFLPLMTLGGLIVLPIMVLSGSDFGRKQSEKHREIMDSVMMMYVTRNPLTSVVCLQAMFLVMAIFGIVGLLSDRLKAIPSPSQMVSSMASKAAHSHLTHHAH
ncbi:hypothetical protein [Stutzerimonas xanthomarina]|uniref:hypothetical protein n=1 Tax=Stutzerimonas xanthomarina TaxID=271420 RepID=UPI003AA7F455